MANRPVIDLDLIDKIQKYANRYHNGNFTKAVNELIAKGLAK